MITRAYVLAFATLLWAGFTHDRVSASELELRVVFFDSETHGLAVMWFFAGQVAADRTIVTAVTEISPRRGRLTDGTSRGVVSEEGLLTLEGPQFPSTLRLYDGELVVDLGSGYAAWVSPFGDVLSERCAQVKIHD